MAKPKSLRASVGNINPLPNNVLVKGAADSQWGAVTNQNAAPPRSVVDIIRNPTPAEAYAQSVAVRSAINARNIPLLQVNARLFNRHGKEVVSGQLLRRFQQPNVGQKFSQFLQTLAIYCDLAAERFIYIHDDKENGEDNVAHVLNPIGAQVIDPAIPRFKEHIKMWRYIWENGKLEQIPASKVIYDLDPNPSSRVRGQSPIIALANSIGAAVEATRYNRSYFANNAEPSSICHLETSNAEIAEQFKREYESSHRGAYKAWRTMFTYNNPDGVGNVKFEPLEQYRPDDPFKTLLEHVQDEVSSIFMVPPLFGGMWNKTRFDSVKEQNDFFFESVFLPRVSLLQDFLQMWVNRLTLLGYSSKEVKFNKALGEKYEKAMATQVDSEVVLVLDCDHIPSVARLKQKHVSYAQALMDTFHLTPRVAAEEVGLELNLNSSADLVWYKSDQKYMPVETAKNNSTMPNPKTPAPVSEPMPTEPDAEQLDEHSDMATTKTSKTVQRKLKHKLITHIIKQLPKLPTLAEFDAYIAAKFKTEEQPFTRQLSRIYYSKLRRLPNVEAQKSYLREA